MLARYVIIIGGPPNSGKSTFAHSLVRALQDQRIDAETKDLDLWAPTLDLIAGKITEDQRNKLKQEKITPEQAHEAKMELRKESRKHQVVVADAPGVISEELRTIFADSTHSVIVCREDMSEEIGRWTEFFGELKIAVIAVVTSKLKGDEKVESNGLIKAVIVGLERSPRDSPAIRQFATLLRSKLGI